MSHTIIPRKEEDHLPNPDEIRRTLTWSFRPGETFEIRTLESQTKGWARTASGYFRDVETAVSAVLQHIQDYDPKQVYSTLNPTTADVYARSRNWIQPNVKNTTQDKEITRLRAILIDCDPVRPSGIPASDTELQAAEKKMQQIKDWLDQHGFPPPLIGMSGNGYHLRYAVDLEVADSSLIKDFLAALAQRFSDAQVKVDRTVFNPSRIAKLYGTFSRKGDDVPEDNRYNRLSRLIECPDRQEVSCEMIQAVITELMPPVNESEIVAPATLHSWTANSGSGRVNMERFFDRRNIQYRANGDGKYILASCVFNPSHNKGEVAVFQNAGGSLAYHCFHDTCAGKGWREFTNVVGRVTSADYDDQPPVSCTSGDAAVTVFSAGPAASSTIKFNAKPASQLAPNETLDWIWHGYIAVGHIAILTALWKAGKSTLLGHLLKQMQKEGSLKPLGQVAQGKALVVSEESEVEWKTRCNALGLSDDHRFLCRPFAGKPSMADYLALIDYVAKMVKDEGYDLVVLDTLGHFLPVDDENDAAKMMKALIPLNRITDAGAALLINHHPRKSQGEEGLSTRGSGALAGFASILMELRRYDASNEEDCRRRLKVLSRHHTPPEAVLELKAGEYGVVGSLSESKTQDRSAIILGLLPAQPPGLTLDEILAQWPDDLKPGSRTLQGDLCSMLETKRITRLGEGKRGSPFRFVSRT